MSPSKAQPPKYLREATVNTTTTAKSAAKIPTAAPQKGQHRCERDLW